MIRHENRPAPAHSESAAEPELSEYVRFEKNISGTAKEALTAGFSELCDALGREKAAELVAEREQSPHKLDDLLWGFTVSGYEAACDLFGERRCRWYLTHMGAAMFHYDRPAIERVARALGDAPPYNLTWKIFAESYPGTWIENAEVLDVRSSLFSRQELRVLLGNRARQVLVADPDLNEEAVREKIDAWRKYWEEDWLELLRKAPNEEFLLRTGPGDLECWERMLPGMRERILSSEDRGDALFMFLTASFRERHGASREKMFDSFTAAQQEAIRTRDIGEIFELLGELRTDHMTELLGKLRSACSPEYLAEMLKEPVPLHRLLQRLPAFKDGKEVPVTNLFAEREAIDAALHTDLRIRELAADHQEIMPYLRLSEWDAKDKRLSREVARLRAAGLAEHALKQEERYDRRFLPSMGIEIEIAKGVSLGEKGERLALAEFAGVPCSADEQWEFCLAPSSTTTEVRLLAEMIRERWVLPEEMTGKNYPLHINLGIPEHVEPGPARAAKLTFALTSAYTNETRLHGRKTPMPLRIRRGELDDATQKNVAGKTYTGRVELRSFAVDAENIYRLLYDSAFSFAALFARERREGETPDEERIRKELEVCWREFEQELDRIFERHGVRPDTKVIDDPDAVHAAREEVLPLLRTLTRKTRTLLLANKRAGGETENDYEPLKMAA